MEDISNKTTDLVDHAGELAETYYKLALANIAQKAANIGSVGIAALIICAIGTLAVLLMGVALSWWLGELLGNRAMGFLLGALFFILLMIIFIGLRKKVILPFFRNLIVHKIYE